MLMHAMKSGVIVIFLTGCGGSTVASRLITRTTIADAPRGTSAAIDLGVVGESQGDLFVFHEALLNEARVQIGSNSGFCIRSQAGAFSECQWTLAFADGTITLLGREAEKGGSVVAVVGGTGDYIGVRGEAVSTPNADGTFTQVLRLLLPR